MNQSKLEVITCSWRKARENGEQVCRDWFCFYFWLDKTELYICDRRPACILLGSALLKSSWIVISKKRWWILISVMRCNFSNIGLLLFGEKRLKFGKSSLSENSRKLKNWHVGKSQRGWIVNFGDFFKHAPTCSKSFIFSPFPIVNQEKCF